MKRAALLLAAVAACAPARADSADDAARSGRLTVMTYNVAGLPDAVSVRTPSKTIPKIGGKLNGYDLVLVQEDFAYPDELRKDVTLPHRSDPGVAILGYGDGLSRFSRLPFVQHAREAWSSCHGLFDSGSDCLTTKGFEVATHELAPGVEVDVYNLHLDAGWDDEDRAARAKQVAQLLASIATRSKDRAVIVAGDTNLRSRRDQATLAELEKVLTDACAATACAQPGRIDRVLVKDGKKVRLTPKTWRIEPGFDGLSDHAPIVVELDWSFRE